MDPVYTLQQPFKVPGGSRHAGNNNASGRGGESSAGAGFAFTAAAAAEAGSAYMGGNGFMFNNHAREPTGASAASPGWSEAAARAVKRAKTAANNNIGSGVVYRDGETTGYEDDGSDAPMVDDWVSIHKKPSSNALRDQSNVHAAASASSSRLGGGFNALRPSNGNTLAPGSRAGVPCSRYYSCTWRKPQAKKHKTWEGDGIMTVTALRAVVQDQSTHVTIASGRLPREPDLLFDEVVSLGGKEVQIEHEIPAADYLSGKAFGSKSVIQSVAPTRPTASTASFYGKSPAASTSSFYGSSSSTSKGLHKKFTAPSVTRPQASSDSAYAKTQLGLPPPTNSFYSYNNAKGKRKEDLSDLEGPDTRLQSGMDSFPSSKINGKQAQINFKPNAKSVTGLGATPKPPKSMWPIDTPGALVMKRFEPDMKKQFNKKDLPVVDVVVDPMIAMRMRDHQKEGIKFMYESVMGMRSEGHGCILADEMGLGKTIQAIALVWTLLRQTPFFGGPTIIQQAVIVCPVTLVKNWKKEFNKWLGKERIRVFTAESKQSIKNFVTATRNSWHVLIIGYERLRTVVDELSKVKLGLMICDEGHRLKSAGAKTTKALRELNIEKRVILSGTPIQNELSEFHAMVDFVNPGILDSYSSFKKIFEIPIMKSRQSDCSPAEKELGQYRAESLSEATSPFILRRTSEVIRGFLPPKSEYVVFIAPTPIQKTVYNHVLQSDLVQDNVDSGGRAALMYIDLLKKICNSPMLLLRAEEMEKKSAELVEYARTKLPPNARSMGAALSGKLKALQSMLRTLKDGTDEKIVVVSNFVQTLNLVQGLCERERYTYCRLDGSTKAEERLTLVDKFNKTSQDSSFVFLLSTKAGGTGLNIIGASRLVLFDSDWNPANDLQAMGRIHRDGQKKECFIYRFITTGTIDEKIYQRQITKIGLADSVMREGTSKSGKDMDAFTTQQLRSLFKLCEDTPCETHDQLQCDCKTGARYVLNEGAQGESMEVDPAPVKPTLDDSDDDDELPDISASFVRASQYRIPKAKVDQDLGQNLAPLKEWLHVNCQTIDERKADNVQDDVLRDMVLRSIESLRISNVRASAEGDDSSDDEDIRPVGTVRKHEYAGGEVTFVLHKKTGALDKSTASSPEPTDV